METNLSDKSPQVGTSWLEKTKQYIQFAQSAVSMGVSIAPLLFIVGFISVNMHLSRYTSIQGYSLQLSRIFAAGIVMSILIIPLAVIADYILYVLFRRSVKFYAGLDLNSEKSMKKRGRQFYSLLSKAFQYLQTAYGIFALLYLPTILITESIGADIYGTLPFQLGGGQPISIILVFEEADTPNLLGLSQEPTNSHRTAPILLLAELTDGLLVYDPTTGRSAAVKNELIVARVNDAPILTAITPIPIATLPVTMTSTSTPDPAVTATQTIIASTPTQ